MLLKTSPAPVSSPDQTDRPEDFTVDQRTHGMTEGAVSILAEGQPWAAGFVGQYQLEIFSRETPA